MEISLNHKTLAATADSVASYLISEDESGLYVIKHTEVKPIAKIFLWLMVQDDEKTQETLEVLGDDFGLLDLYYQLEDEGALNIEKKDLTKYKFYIDSIYSLIRMAEALNKVKAEKATLEFSSQIKALTDAFQLLGDQVASISEDTIAEKAAEVETLLQSIGQTNEE